MKIITHMINANDIVNHKKVIDYASLTNLNIFSFIRT